MALHKLVLDDLELTALITHLEGESEMMNESRLNRVTHTHQTGKRYY